MMGTVASKLWPPFLHPRTGGHTPAADRSQAPAAPVESSSQCPASQGTQPTDQEQDYLDLLENMRRTPADVRRTDRFFILLFALITLAWAAAGVIWWLHRR